MDDNKREKDDVVSSDQEANNSEARKSEEVSSNTSLKKKSGLTTYVVSVLIVLIMAVALIFVLEKQGRINTGIFTNIITEMRAKAPVAKVNGVVIPNRDLESGIKQLSGMAKLQGADFESEEALKSFREEALETLINGELLRQVAIEKGKVATAEAIQNRLDEISEDVGGKEVLDERMAEFGIDENNLRRDIENEILIQSLFDSEVTKDDIKVTDEEVKDLYDKANVDGKLPPIEEVRDQVIEQINTDKYNKKITDYIEKIKSEAKIEIF